MNTFKWLLIIILFIIFANTLVWGSAWMVITFLGKGNFGLWAILMVTFNTPIIGFTVDYLFKRHKTLFGKPQSYDRF